MLSVMRRSANSWVLVLLFAAIIFVFAFNFGPWAGNVGGGVSYAADVNGRVITLPEFQTAYSRQFQMIQSYRPGYTNEQADREGLRKIVLDQLVSKQLLANLAREHGLSISDAELAAFIRERLFGDGRAFDRETYRRLIYSNFQSTEAQFEAQLRRDLLAERMATLLGTGAYVSDDEVSSTFVNRSTRVSLDVVRIDGADKDSRKFTNILLADLKKGTPLSKLALKGHEKSVKILSTGFFRQDSRFIPEVGQNQDMIFAAFSLSKENPVSNQVFQIDSAYFLIKLKDKEVPDMKKFAEEQKSIKETLLMMRKKQLMENYVLYLKKKASIKYNEQLIGA
jgi:SurA N-terminal domain